MRPNLDYLKAQSAEWRKGAAAKQSAKVRGIQSRNAPTYTSGGSPFSPRTTAYSPRASGAAGLRTRGSQPWQGQLNNLIQKMEDQAVAARTANLQRYEQAMGIYKNIEEMYQPGGAFETAAYEQLEKQKTADLAYAAQQGVSSGLSQTTRQQYAGKRWTEDVGVPATVQIQAQAQQALAGAMGQRAGFIERREDEYPDYATIAQLAMQASR